MEHVHVSASPDLDHALLIGALAGWNDASSAATWALKFLINQLDAQVFAEIDPDDFYDFTSSRPQIRIAGGSVRRISWPANRFYACRANREGDEPRKRDIVLFLGEEPQYHWKAFSQALVTACQGANVDEVLMLGSLVAEVPHTAPIQISGTASQSAALRRFPHAGVQRATYSGSTGLLTILLDAASRAGVSNMSLWGIAPHYVSATPNLPVSEALLQRVDSLHGLGLNLRDLGRAAQRFTKRVSSLVAEDPDIAAYVRELEKKGGGEAVAQEGPYSVSDASGIHKIPMDGDLPSPEQAIEGVEEWLRQFRDPPGAE